MPSYRTFKLMALLSAIGLAWTKSVATTNGTIRGGKCDGYDADYFLSIPYAKPPVGDLRFGATEPYNDKYKGGVLHATSSAPRCIQFGNIFVESGDTSEDWYVATRRQTRMSCVALILMQPIHRYLGPYQCKEGF